MNVVEQNLSSVFEICRVHHVKNMYLFGSILTENFSSDSDVDFLVSFDKVDLLEEQTVKNPVLRRSIDRNKKLIYG